MSEDIRRPNGIATAGLDPEVEAFATHLDEREVSFAHENADFEWIRLVQDQVWAEHSNDVIPIRQKIVEPIVSSLRDAPGRVLGIESQAYAIGSRHRERGWLTYDWEFASLQESESGSPVELKTHVWVWSDKYMGTGDYIPAIVELQQAFDYLRRPVKGGECPERLLGTSAVGMFSRRHIPNDELQHTYDIMQRDYRHFMLDNLSELGAYVSARILGSKERGDTVHRATIQSSWHDPNDRSGYPSLQHRNAAKVKEDLIRKTFGYRFGRQIKPDRLLSFLRERPEAKDHDAEYEALERIGAIILKSVPDTDF